MCHIDFSVRRLATRRHWLLTDLQPLGKLGPCEDHVRLIKTVSSAPGGHGVQGNTLVCPAKGFTLQVTPPAGRLDGLTCYSAATALAVELGVTPQNTVASQVRTSHSGLSGAAIFGIMVVIALICAAIGGVGYILWQRQVGWHV